jgi:hypothetical protein
MNIDQLKDYYFGDRGVFWTELCEGALSNLEGDLLAEIVFGDHTSENFKLMADRFKKLIINDVDTLDFDSFDFNSFNYD